MRQIPRMLLCILTIPGLPAPALADTVKPEVADKEPMICKTQKRTNSRFTTKVCRTVAEWEAIREAASATWKEARDRPAIETRRGG